jgi:hypothetical protein
MVRSNWETATGEVRVLMDAQTAHELYKLLQREASCVELFALRNAIGHTIQHPDTRKEKD